MRAVELPPKTDPPASEVFQQYQVVASRRQQFDLMIWQVPVLGLTAQAFLLNIALSHGTSQVARALSAGLAVVTSGAFRPTDRQASTPRETGSALA